MGEETRSTDDEESELARKLGPRVFAFAIRHVRDDVRAADLTQDVLVIAIEALREGRLRDRDQIGSFMLGTCRLLILDGNRTSARRDRLLERFREDLMREVSPEPASDGYWRLFECLRRLTHRARRVLHLSFFENRDATSIACSTKTTPENVRVIRHRSLVALRECLTRGEK